MLGIHGVAKGGADYYLSDLGQELPVAVPPRWAGAAASAFGRAGALEDTEFRRLLLGHHPGTGAPVGSDRTKLGALDLTFSAPKSVSVLFALGGEDAARRVVVAHAEAVTAALAYLERHAVTATRRRGGERTVLPTDGMVAGQFTHGVTRNGDPHLHSHVVMANLVHGADGRWSACDRRGLEAHRDAAAAAYEAHLRAALSSMLGVGWASPRSGRTPEIIGVPSHLLGEFSSRGADIRRHMHDVGARPGRGGRVAWAVTRPPKEPARSFADLAAAWRRAARNAGQMEELGPARLARCARRGPQRVDEHRFAGVLSLTPHGGAHRRDVVAALAGAATDGIRVGSLEQLVELWVPPGPVGVHEPLLARGAVVPATHLLRTLGARPLDPAAHEVWVGAARTIDAYRDRWGLQRSPEALGPSSSLGSLPAARLAEHIRTVHHVRVARTRLGWREPAGVELGLVR